jgi:hypothetical protein
VAAFPAAGLSVLKVLGPPEHSYGSDLREKGSKVDEDMTKDQKKTFEGLRGLK